MIKTLVRPYMSNSATASNRLSTLSRHLSASNGNMAETKRFANPALFICDIQEKFRPAIYEFPKVISTAEKMIKAAKILNIPIYITTQNAARLGPTVSELTTLLPTSLPSSASTMTTVQPPTLLHDKTLFSMLTPTLTGALAHQAAPPERSGSVAPSVVSAVIVGIETHICVTQTALDLLASGHKVYVLADGVSSCNDGERKIALDRLRAAGVVVSSSESVLFEILRDAKGEKFKEVSALIKETKEGTREAVQTFTA